MTVERADAHDRVNWDVVRTTEWASAIFRLLNVVLTAAAYPQSGASMSVLGALGLVDTWSLWASVQGRGPLGRGRRGVAVIVAITIVGTLLLGLTMPRRTLLTIHTATPLSIYAAPLFTIAVLVTRSRRPLNGSTISMTLLVVPVFGVAAVLNGYPLSGIDWFTIGFQSFWLLVGALLGLVIRRLVVSATTARAAAIEKQFEAFHHWVHSDVQGELVAVGRTLELARERGDLRAGDVETAVDHVVSKILEQNLEVLLADDDVSIPLTHVLHVTHRRWARLVTVDLPPVGMWQVSGRTARMVLRVLNDLVNNSIKYGGPRVQVSIERVPGDGLVIDVHDNGPGFSEVVLAEPGRSLYDLARDLRSMGGKLDKKEGSRVQATIPE